MFHDRILSSFNGVTFKMEPSSNLPHYNVKALGSYRDSPFVTGQYSSTEALYTEILDYEAQTWEQVANYPFARPIGGTWYVE